ncbi:pantoate--beta-alanine ligase (plasmid) [Coraliomargarita sp. W4R53]
MTAVIRTVAELRAHLSSARAAAKSVGLVPTMGALHEGHLHLIREAAAQCDEVVVSVFVNPTQFNSPDDLSKYPRNEDHDVEAAAAGGATVIFAPAASEVYPAGFSTSIRVLGVSERWEGATRGANHFDGVATVVAKLLSMVGADAAWFGEKDAQQVAVVRRLAEDLNMPTAVHTVPTARADDGIALSSRNARLAPNDRARALSLYESLNVVSRAHRAGERDAEVLITHAQKILRASSIEAEYWAIVDPDTFEPLERVDSEALAIVAAVVGGVRLIDNVRLPAQR